MEGSSHSHKLRLRLAAYSDRVTQPPALEEPLEEVSVEDLLEDSVEEVVSVEDSEVVLVEEVFLETKVRIVNFFLRVAYLDISFLASSTQ